MWRLSFIDFFVQLLHKRMIMLPKDGSANNGEIITVEISDIARGGAGVAREENGRVIFIPRTAPGDLVRARIVDEHKHYAQGELIEVITPSPSRVEPRCLLFGRCGGCEWQHLPYELQWQIKIRGVGHALTRLGLTLPDTFEEFPAANPWEYRNRIQLRGFKDELGFFEQKSHRLVSATRCEISRPEINATWERIRGEGAKLSRPYKVEVEVSRTGEIKTAWNSKHGAMGFRQVFDEQNDLLRAWIAKTLTPNRNLLDLFGGSGNLSLGLAPRMLSVDCVDTSAPRATPEGTPSNYHFHRASVLSWIILRSKNTAQIQGATSSAILDPPRAGLGKSIGDIEPALRKLGVNELVAVGCDPDSWSRDLCSFNKRGWRIVKCASFDFFPQTPHVESVAFLRIDN